MLSGRDHVHVAVLHSAPVALVAPVCELRPQVRRLPLFQPLWLGEDVGGVVLGGQCARKGAAVHTAEGSEPVEVG